MSKLPSKRVPMSNRAIWVALPVLAVFAEEKLPWAFNYKLGRTLRGLYEEHQRLQKFRNEMLREHALHDSKTGDPVTEREMVGDTVLSRNVFKSAEDRDAFTTEWEKVLDETTDVRVYYLSPDELDALGGKECKECKRQSREVLSAAVVEAMLRVHMIDDPTDEEGAAP